MNVTTNELIPISDNNGKKAVNARDLHSFLESKRDFSTWIKDRINLMILLKVLIITPLPKMAKLKQAVTR